MLRRLLKPFVRRIRRVLWFAATLVLVVWLVELVTAREPGVVAKWLVPAAFVALLLTWLLQRKFWRLPDPQNRETKIVIVGAGPAGLSAAYFLKQQGYREVLVLEKLGRVGGLCRTITEDYYNFDLGANYVTPAYKETLALADEVGAEQYAERPIMTIDFTDPANPPEFSNPWQTVTQGTSGLVFIGLCIKYIWLRFRLGRVINTPGHAKIHMHPELCVPFLEWLKKHRLERLQRLFEAPISVMGYGYLHEIPAPYALKYMSLPTFIALALKSFPLTNWFPWPRRFVLGFQRLWEALAWGLNVRFNVTIDSITRRDDKVVVEFSHQEQVLHQTEPHQDTMEFDKLILACPLTKDVLTFLDATDEECELFEKIDTHSYCLTSFTTRGIRLDRPIAAALPLPDVGMPWAITKQMEDSNLFQFYSRVRPEWESGSAEERDETDGELAPRYDLATKEQGDSVRRNVVAKVREVVDRLGGEVADDQWHTFDRWPYFQHVSADAMRDGYYERLESLQGLRNTYYVGAIMNFELVESCIEYSKHLVRKHFQRL
jgi:hypothetical protein